MDRFSEVFLGRLFSGRIFGRMHDDQLDGFCDNELGTKLLWAFHSIFLGFFGHFQNPHLNFTSVWWQVGRSTSPPFEPGPFPDHARITSCTTPSLNLHNVPRALLPSVFSDSFSLSFVSFSSSSDVRMSTAAPERWSMLTKRFHQLLKGDLHGGGWGFWGGQK